MIATESQIKNLPQGQIFHQFWVKSSLINNPGTACFVGVPSTQVNKCYYYDFKEKRSYSVSCERNHLFVCISPIDESFFNLYENSPACPTNWFYSYYHQTCFKYFQAEKNYCEASKFCFNFSDGLAQFPSTSFSPTLLFRVAFFQQMASSCGINSLCKNGGTCLFDINSRRAKCNCPSDFTGHDCTKKLININNKCNCMKNCDSTGQRCNSDGCIKNWYGDDCSVQYTPPEFWVNTSNNCYAVNSEITMKRENCFKKHSFICQKKAVYGELSKAIYYIIIIIFY